MNNSISNTSLSGLSTVLSRVFHRFGFIALFLIVATGLMISVLLLVGVIAKTDNPGDYAPDTSATTFDQATMDKIEGLSQKSTVDTGGRLLPFW
ncbi:MAG TPA: hypothetical protein VGE13_01760 [Candidatus Saccharimonadales bacterium]